MEYQVTFEFSSSAGRAAVLDAVIAAFSAYSTVNSVTLAEVVEGSGAWTCTVTYIPAAAYTSDQVAQMAVTDVLAAVAGTAIITAQQEGIDINSIMNFMMIMVVMVMMSKMMKSATFAGVGEKAGGYVGRAGEKIGRAGASVGEWVTR